MTYLRNVMKSKHNQNIREVSYGKVVFLRQGVTSQSCLNLPNDDQISSI